MPVDKRVKHKPRPTSMKRVKLVTVPDKGFLSVEAVLNIFPVGRDHWHAGVRTGRYPAPVKIASRVKAWRAEDIHKLVATVASNFELHELRSLKKESVVTFERLARQWVAKREREPRPASAPSICGASRRTSFPISASCLPTASRCSI